MNKASTKYYQDLKFFIPIHDKVARQLLQNIFLRLSELNAQNPNITYEIICSELGSPNEIAAEYFSNSDSAYLSKKLRYAHFLRLVCICSMIIIIILSGIRIHYLNQAHKMIQDTNITHEIETIK